MLYLTGHDCFLDSLGLEEANQFSQLADPDPGKALDFLFNARVSLFADGRDRKGNTRPACPFDTMKGKRPFPAINP